jgi:tetratricopeptide (TPR) repeat protein
LSEPEFVSEPAEAEPPPAKVAAAEISSKKFHDGPVPGGIYECLGLPEGAAGQGIAQAYSKRLRRIQKLLDERHGDRQIEAWKEALLRAYRIVNHSEALAIYDKMVLERGSPEGVAAYVVSEMGKKSLARGIQNLRRGNVFEGAKSIHESITWLPDSAEAWLALGFYQASLEESDEAGQALVSFGKALELAPDNGRIRYLHAVTAHYCGDRSSFDNDREWLNKNAESAPSAWAAFLSHLKAA